MKKVFVITYTLTQVYPHTEISLDPTVHIPKMDTTNVSRLFSNENRAKKYYDSLLTRCTQFGPLRVLIVDDSTSIDNINYEVRLPAEK
ncbi:hypothetical protein [Chitinophaga sp. 212800010-3]|uniref:hypothetical protein n=1 Tax=unclassified Chitinophaga TaxID=2619133 RepID=UPI002DEB93DF|nr:hypothetical protein [Chitinophaga sp. 212800010-3]